MHKISYICIDLLSDQIILENLNFHNKLLSNNASFVIKSISKYIFQLSKSFIQRTPSQLIWSIVKTNINKPLKVSSNYKPKRIAPV